MSAVELSRFAGLSAAILSDVLDSVGLMGQALRPFVRPLDEECVMIGRARTGLYMPVYEVRPDENPYKVEIALVDDLRPGDVPVLACNGPLDPKGRGRMVERDTLIEYAGVRVVPGDIVFGDADGAVVNPLARAEEVLERAHKKVTGENHTRAELEQGALLGEGYRKLCVL